MLKSPSSMPASDPILTSPSSSTASKTGSTETTDRSGRSRYTSGLIVSDLERSSESQLWRSVLGQTICDISDNDPRVRQDVFLWMCSEDFDIVCGFADVHVEDMREQLVRLSVLPPILAKKYGRSLRKKITACP
jgi:hypothetical protein